MVRAREISAPSVGDLTEDVLDNARPVLGTTELNRYDVMNFLLGKPDLRGRGAADANSDGKTDAADLVFVIKAGR